MKLVVDVCAGQRLAAAMKKAGHEVDFVGNWPSDPGDQEILKKAYDTGAVVITRDKDFGTLAVLHRQNHCGILRLVEIPAHQESGRCIDALQRYEALLGKGALITVEATWVRIRELE